MSRIIATSANFATVASQAKIEALTSMAVQLRVRMDELRAFTNATFNTLFLASGKGTFQIRLFRDPDGSVFSQVYVTGMSNTFGGAVFDMVTLPANGTDLIIYADFISESTANIAIQAASGGSPIVDSTHGSALAAMTTGSGTGSLSFQRSCFDSIAIFNARRTGAARFAKPEPGDADIVSLYYFAEGTGSTSADAVSGGTAVALGSTTWTTGGTWNSSSVGSPTVDSIAPTSGPVGTEVTMTGTNLTGATAATHGPSIAMTGLVVDSATQVRATIASGSPASGTVRVTTPGGTATGPTFTITPIYSGIELVDNPNVIYTVGLLLLPIVFRAIDQFGATFLGTVPADGDIPAGFASAAEITLPVDVIGTLLEPFVAGFVTWDNLTVVAAVVGTGALLRRRRLL